jgi:hypothetical protein
MNISPTEAEESLADIQRITQKTRRSLASSGAPIFLILTGAIWLVGFVATQFLIGPILAVIWISASLIGLALSIPLGLRLNRRVRSPSTAVYSRRIGLFWLFLACFAIAVIAVARPTDAKQLNMLVILFILLGQLSMGLVFSFSTVWWVLPIAALALLGYFLLPAYFYLWMGILVGGGMIALGLYILLKW